MLFFSFLVIVSREDEFCDRLSKNADFSGFTPLHYAALSDDYECIKLLLEAGNAKILCQISSFFQISSVSLLY